MAFSSGQDSNLRRLLKVRRSEVSNIVITTTFDTVNVVDNTSASHTVYTFQLRRDPTTTSAADWTIKKRYSQCFQLRFRLQQEAGWRSWKFKRHELLGPLVKTLEKAGNEFPRKHTRFDTATIIRERRRGLTNFVLSILAAYTDLDVLIAAGEYGSVELSALYTILERFLEIPRERKQLEMQLAELVLVLKDVKLDTAGSCCICLGDDSPSNDTPIMQQLRLRNTDNVNITARAEEISDNQSTAAPYTQYIFTLERSTLQWTIRKRYSQCYEFYLRIRQATHWEWTSVAVQETFKPLVKLLEHAAGSEFPRKHLRFDNEPIIRERCQKLADFVLTLLTAYVYLEVLVGPMGCPHSVLNSGENDPWVLFRDTERFLEIPLRWRTMEALSERTMLSTEVPEHVEAIGSVTMAGLPCGHTFHDDCIILWLRSNGTCPVCRRSIK
ncbi:E3 ubiquitin-protein ligase [Phytophthora citrophthora]|uniref:E3 ubiquitin-protein ligase n=1 Tax=Phytophthora citrophthora TaxID=4793 RepID=A0AAD9LR57_9STRA|nr:E3 ubiquitin-protein ligase [Phytophthora citrophthora]